MHLDHVIMPTDNGQEKTKGRSLNVLSAIKKVLLGSSLFVFGSPLIIAMARVNGDPNYTLYMYSKCMKRPVEDHLKASGVDLSNGGGLKVLEQFQ